MTATADRSCMKVPKNETAFRLCRATNNLWNKKVFSMSSWSSMTAAIWPWRPLFALLGACSPKMAHRAWKIDGGKLSFFLCLSLVVKVRKFFVTYGWHQCVERLCLEIPVLNFVAFSRYPSVIMMMMMIMSFSRWKVFLRSTALFECHVSCI